MCPWEETHEPFAVRPIFQQGQHRTQSNQQHRPTETNNRTHSDTTLIGVSLLAI